MTDLRNIYGDHNIYDYANMYLKDNTMYFNEFLHEFNDAVWYVLYHKVTANPYIYENYKCIICLNEVECVICLQSNDFGDDVYFKKTTKDKSKLIEEFYRGGIKELDIFISDRFLELSIIHYQSKVSAQSLKQKGIFSELFKLIQNVISNKNNLFEYKELKKMENNCYDKLLENEFDCKFKIQDNEEVIEQLIDKDNKTVWFACYTELTDKDDEWMVKTLPLLQILKYVSNANGIIINPYAENIRLNNSIIGGIKKYVFRKNIISDLIHDNAMLTGPTDIQDMKRNFFRLFERHDNIKKVYLQRIMKDKQEAYLVMLDLKNDNSMYFNSLSKELSKILNSHKIYILKVWDIDELFLQDSIVIYSKYS